MKLDNSFTNYTKKCQIKMNSTKCFIMIAYMLETRYSI